MNKKQNILASTGLAIGAAFGVAGSIFTDPASMQIALYEISSVGLIAASTLLAVKYLRSNNDLIATGFLLFAIGEAIMSVGTAGGQVAAQPAFAAGMALYIPSLLFLSIPKEFPIWSRIAGIAACVPFLVAASKIFLGEQVLSTSPFPGAGYGLLTITIIGWIWTLLRKK
jgi:hypothetical protein